ncbi:MAG: hypothetical protein ACXAB7_14790 [Candidatus Kariarchaeaceae archaeon]|jgi:hypothetical protein
MMSEDSIDMRSSLRKLADDLRSKEPILLEYIKGIDNKVRLGVCVSLIDGDKDFSMLHQELSVPKTLLSNHLQLLVSCKLVSKLSHGTYQLTDTGLLLIESLEDFVSRTSRRKSENPLAYLMSKPKIERMNMTKNMVKNIPKFQPSWISLISTTTGILQSFGEEVDTTDVAGYTGHAFVACMTKGITSAAPPTAHPFFQEVHEGTESMGFKLHGTYEPGAIFPTQKIKLKDQKRLIKLFEKIKEQIDNNNPVILWGPVTAEFAIVHGYDEDNYLVSTFRTSQGKEETPIHYMDLHSPGGLWYYYFGERTHQMTEEHDFDAIKRAIIVASGRNQKDALVGVVEFDEDYKHITDWSEVEVQFVSGPEAFLVWKKNLTDGKLDSMGNSLCAGSYQEGYAQASEFLNRIARKYPEKKFHSKLVEASKAYGDLANTMQEYCKLFPFPGGNETKEDLEIGSSLLSRCEKQTRQGIELLKEVIDLWNGRFNSRIEIG